MVEFLQTYLGADLRHAGLVVLNLILIESLLSIDNAAVLATMVMKLPDSQRKKALRIGLIFAYIFRGTCLILAGWLMKISWLKLLGGGYLFFLFVQFFAQKYVTNSKNPVEDEAKEHKAPEKSIFGLNTFWSTVIMVELMDLTFSIDNVFAAVALTKNIYLVCLGVFIGIITMRIVAGYFVQLMQRFPFLDEMAFAVIGLLGLKLILSFVCQYSAESFLCHWLENETADFYFSLLTVAIFTLPILSSVFFNVPKGSDKK